MRSAGTKIKKLETGARLDWAIAMLEMRAMQELPVERSFLARVNKLMKMKGLRRGWGTKRDAVLELDSGWAGAKLTEASTKLKLGWDVCC